MRQPRAATPAWSFSRGHHGGGGLSASSQCQFQWPYFVQRREWFRQHFEGEGFHIAKFEVAWRNRWDEAVFLGQRNGGKMFMVDPWVWPAVEQLSWKTDDIAEI